jgi:hypothetical protein
LRDPISKIPNTKRAGGVAQGVGPEFKPQYRKKKKEKKELLLGMVAHTCNPSYTGGRGQKDRDWRSARTKISKT